MRGAPGYAQLVGSDFIMMRATRFSLAWVGALVMACGTPGGGNDDGDGDGDATDTPNPTTATTSATTMGPVATSAPSGSGGSGDGPTATTTAADSSEDGPDDGPPPINLDQGVIPDAPMFCTEGEGDVEFSYIWVANSTQSTISKINTETLVEEGRYYTKPNLAGSPSRTSVSLTGNVATANRNGYTNTSACHGNADWPYRWHSGAFRRCCERPERDFLRH